MNRTQKLIFAAVWEIAVILRLWGLWTTRFWYDEAFSFLVARLPFERMLQAVIHDVHPPLYYILAAPWAQLPWQPTGLRLFSVLCSLLALGAFWLLTGRYNLTMGARLAGLAVMAIWPVQLFYAQEARMYALFEWEILTLWLMVLERRYVYAGTWALFALYTHNFAVFYVAALGLYALLNEAKRPYNFYTDPLTTNQEQPNGHAQVSRAFMAFFVPFLLWLPWAGVVAFIQVPETLKSNGGYWLDFLTPGSMLLSTAGIFFTVQGSSLTNSLAVILMAVGVPVLTWHAWRHGKCSVIFLALFPILAVIFISLTWRQIFLNRGFFPSTPALCLLLGEWLVTTAWQRRAYALALIIPALIGAYTVWISTTTYGIRTMSVNYAGAMALDDRPIIHMDGSSVIIWMAARPDLPQYVLRGPCPEPPGSLTEPTRQAIGFRYITKDQLPARYHVVSIENIFSTTCDLERNAAMVKGDIKEFGAPLLFGEVEVWGHQ